MAPHAVPVPLGRDAGTTVSVLVLALDGRGQEYSRPSVRSLERDSLLCGERYYPKLVRNFVRATFSPADPGRLV